MPYLELSLRCSESDQPRYENALEDVGALSVTLLDADADTSNEHAILEPGVGQTPLWHALVLTALFPAETNALALLAAACCSGASDMIAASAVQIAGKCAGLLRWPGNIAGAMSGESVSSTTEASGSRASTRCMRSA